MADEIKALHAAVVGSKTEVLDAFASFRKELYGNGARNADGTQAGIIPYIERHLTSIDQWRDEHDQRVAFVAEIDEAKEERESRRRDRKVESYRDELDTNGRGPVAHAMRIARETPPVMWAILVIVGGPRVFELLIALLKQAQSLWAGGGGP